MTDTALKDRPAKGLDLNPSSSSDIARGGDHEYPRFAAVAIAAQLQGDTDTMHRLIRMLAEGPKPRPVKNLTDDSGDE